jgi:hypothetical protein
MAYMRPCQGAHQRLLGLGGPEGFTACSEALGSAGKG